MNINQSNEQLNEQLNDLKIQFNNSIIRNTSNKSSNQSFNINISYLIKSNNIPTRDKNKNDYICALVDGNIADFHKNYSFLHTIHLLNKNDIYAKSIINHTCAHILAMAVQEVFQDAKVCYSKQSNSGFYYDFYNIPFPSDDQIQEIKKIMNSCIQAKSPVTFEQIECEKALNIFKNQGEDVKVNKINDLIKSGETHVNIYAINFSNDRYNIKWIDLCNGPHITHAGYISRFFDIVEINTITKKYSSDLEMEVLRFSCIVWENEEKMKIFKKDRSLNELYDHQSIGNAMNMFHFQEEGRGDVFWHNNGSLLFSILENKILQAKTDLGFKEIRTPLMMKSDLWKKSGHWEAYSENMFTACCVYNKESLDSKDKNNDEFALRPMNCPGAVQIFNSLRCSYKDLPVRLMENGKVFRNEASGALKGLARMRVFTIDDSHIFCTSDHIKQEIEALIEATIKLYKLFDFEILIYLSTQPEESIGEQILWDDMTTKITSALGDRKFIILEGEGAFYGPKIEFHIQDSSGRSWQCGTIQLDFNMPQRLNAEYIDNNNSKLNCVMIHAAMLGSYERFISILLEHYKGSLPFWLCPMQFIILPINTRNIDYAKSIFNSIIKSNISLRISLDTNEGTLNYKIKKYNKLRCFAAIIIGDNEQDNESISIRTLMKKSDIINCKKSDMIEILNSIN